MVTADPFPGRAIVLYDGDCPFCRRSVALLRTLDWLGRLAYHSARDDLPPAEVPLDRQKMLDEMHVLTRDRKRTHVGYRAIRWLAWRLPLTLPVAPLLYLPGVPWLGSRLYRWIARNRMDLVPCRADGCRVNKK